MKKCCGTNVPHCHCGGDKGHNILPGCPGYKAGGKMLDALIVGGDSRIGKALYKKLWQRGYRTNATSRREDFAGGPLFLDLRDPGPLPAARVTYLCAAVTGFKPCEDDPQEAWHVNVNGTLKVARDQIARGGKIVFLSSSASVSHLSKNYGYYKLKAEQELFTLGENAAVVRFGPVRSDTRETYPDGYYDPIDMEELTDFLIRRFADDFSPGCWPLYSPERAVA